MKQQIDADIAANETYGQAQLAGLDAKKTKSFQQIDQNAQNKNMFFSGLSVDDQANYTADTYLPAVAALANTIATTRSGLIKEKLGLDKDVFDKSWQAVETDRTVLADWNKMTAQQQFDAGEAEKQRVWQAQQNERDRAISLASASRGGGGGGGGGYSGGGGSDDSDPTAPLTSALGAWMKSQGKMPSRQAQDAFVNSWFDSNGIKGADNRQLGWNAVNATFQRVSDPTKDWTWKK